jgi:hypothetical protein
VGGGYLLVKDLDEKGGSIEPSEAVEIARADDFDPLGGDGEHPEVVDLVHDGDDTTAWRTETYSTQDLGGKEGVGIYVVLSDSTSVSSVEVVARQSGWDAEVYVAAAPATSLSGWGSPVAEGSNLGTTATFEVDPERTGGAVLIWITRVAEGGRLELLEVRVG